ncbi:MAG: proline dehydrogenase family protein [Proteobacteria bacterium]|nr:proline dehydrogenase family protein [Pseudomonadota bacterium]
MSVFDRSRIGFSHLSSRQLKGRLLFFWIFHIGLSNTLTFFIPIMLMLPRLFLPLLTLTLKRFYGAATLEKAWQSTQDLRQRNIRLTLDYCTEDTSKTNNSMTLRHLYDLIQFCASKPGHIPFCVLKITALCPKDVLMKVSSQDSSLLPSEKKHYKTMCSKVHQLCLAAQKKGVKVLIDAEESWIQDAIDDLVEKLMLNYNTSTTATVYHTLQMYRYDRLHYLKKLHQKCVQEKRILAIKLVRGAYLDKERHRAKKHNYPSPLFETKKETDTAYDAALAFCLQQPNTIFTYIATHNEKSIEKALPFFQNHNVETKDSQLCFSQLLGMGDHISFYLAQKNYPVTKYIPYGPYDSMLPYLLRRAQENASLEGHGKREYELLKKEKRWRQNHI